MRASSSKVLALALREVKAAWNGKRLTDHNQRCSNSRRIGPRARKLWRREPEHRAQQKTSRDLQEPSWVLQGPWPQRSQGLQGCAYRPKRRRAAVLREAHAPSDNPQPLRVDHRRDGSDWHPARSSTPLSARSAEDAWCSSQQASKLINVVHVGLQDRLRRRSYPQERGSLKHEAGIVRRSRLPA